MRWLDPRYRCNRCGTAFADDGVITCPGCRADLAVIGTQNELQDWGVTRQKGRRRFVWVRCVLGCGIPLVAISVSATLVARWVKGSTEWAALDYLISVPGWLVVCWVVGHLWWRGAEREYAAWVTRPPGQKPAAPNPAPDSGHRI